MSFLDFFIGKEKPKVVLTPETPVKAPETLLTLKTPITPAKRSMLEEIQQADSAARITPNKAPVAASVTPRKSMLEQIQEGDTSRSVIGGEFTPTPIDVTKVTKAPVFVTDIGKSINIGTQQGVFQSGVDFLGWMGNKLEKRANIDNKNVPNFIENFTDNGIRRVAKKMEDISKTTIFQDTIKDISATRSQGVKDLGEKDFEFKDVTKPEFWTSTVSEQVPTLLMYLVPGTAIAKLKSLGTIGKMALGGLVNTATESTQNASNTYNQVLTETGDKEKANIAAGDVFKDNMKMIVNNPIQFGLDFIPGGGVVTKVGKFLASSGLEAGEELYTQYAQNNAVRRSKGEKEQTFGELINSPEGKETLAVSVALGGAGNISASFGVHAGYNQDEEAKADAEKNLTPDQKKEFDKGVIIGEQKLTEKLADIKQSIKTPEDQKIVEEALNEKQLKKLQEISIDPSTNTTIITTKESNALNQKLDTTDTNTFIESSKKVLEEQGYDVQTKDGSKQKGSLSKYLLVSKGGSKQVVIRVSDHVLPDNHVEKFGVPAVAIDLSARKVMPFDIISEAVSGKDVKVVPQEQSYKASDRLKEFNAIKDNLSDAQLVQYDTTKAEEGLVDAVSNEIAKRNISVEDQIALGDTPVEKYVAPVASVKRQSFLEQAMAQELVPEYSPGMADLMDQRKSLIKLINDATKKNKSLPKSKQIPTKRLRGDLSKLDISIRKYARANKEVNPILKKKSGAVQKQTPQEITQGAINEFNTEGSATSYLNGLADDYINGKMTITEFNAAFKNMKQESPSQKFMDEVLEAEAGVVLTINEELRELEEKQESTGDYSLFDILDAQYQEVSYNEIKAIQAEAIKRESGDMNSLPQKMKDQIDLMALETESFQDDIFNDIMGYDFTVDKNITKIDKRCNWLQKKLNQFQERKIFNPKTPVVSDTTMETTREPFNIPETLNAAVDEITNYREDMVPIEQISYAIESAANSRVARIEVSKILEDLDATPDTAQAFLDYADSRKRNEVDPLSNEAFSDTPFELKEKDRRDRVIQDAFVNGDFRSIVENVGIGGTFSVIGSGPTPAPLIGNVVEITSEEYHKRTGDKLKAGDVAYEVVTEFVPKEVNVDIQFKSGIGFSMRNAWTSIKLAAQGIFTGNVIAPFLTLTKWGTRKAIGIFGAKHILGVVYDKTTGRNGTQLLSSSGDEKIANTKALANLEDTYQVIEKEIFSRRDEISKAFSKLVAKIDSLIENPTNNTLTGEAYSKKDREVLKKVILSFGVDSRSLSDTKEFSNSQKNTLNYTMALSQAFSYYPKEMRSIMGNDLADFFLSDFMKETTERSPIYTTGGNSLVQMKEAGLKQEDVISGTYHPGANIDPTQALLTPDERSYQHYHINGNVVAYLIKNQIIPTEFEGQDIEQIISYLTMQQSLETNTVAKEQIGNQIKRIRDVITKAKGQDNLDMFRLHFPLMQKYFYAKHVANVIFQKETIKLLQGVDLLMPDTVTSGKWTVGLVEDIFIGDKKTMTYQEAKRLEAIYGEGTILKEGSDSLKAIAKSTGEASAKLASAGLATSKSLVKGVVSLAYSFLDPRIETVSITGNKAYEEFALLNGLISGKGRGFFQRGTDDLKLNLEHARAQLETSMKLGEVTDANGTYTVISSLAETARGGITNFMFANAIEEMVAYKGGQLHLMDQVSEITGKKYQNGMKVNMEEVMADFETLSTTQKEDVMDSTKAYMARNYDTQTQTKSTIRFLRMNELNFLRNYMTKLVANSVLRAIDTKTYKNLEATKPHTKVSEENNTADLANDVSNAISPDERLSKNTQVSMNLLRQQAVIASLLMSAYIGIKALTGDDEEKEKNESYYASLFQEAYFFVTNNFMNVGQNTTTALLQPVSLGTGFSIQYVNTFKDLLYQKFVTKSQTGYDQEWYKFVKMNGVLGQALDLAFNTAKPQTAMTASGKVTYIREAGFTPWLLESALPGNVSYSSQQAAGRAIMWEKTKGIGLLGELIGDWVDVQKMNADMAISNLKNSIPFTKTVDTTDKHQAYYAADLLLRLEEIIRENPELNLIQGVKKMYAEKGISQLGQYDIFGKVLGGVKTMDAKNKKIEAVLNKPELLMYKGFTFNAKEKASITWNNIMQNPQIALGFTSLLVDLDALKEGSVSEEATLKKNISEPDPKSYLGSALAMYQKSPRFTNTLVRNIDYSVEGMHPDKNENVDTIRAYMDRLNTILTLGKNNPSLDRDIYKSLQAALATKAMEGTMYEIALANNTANAGKWPEITQALVLMADDRSLTNKEYNDIKAGNLNYEVSQKLIEANKGKMPNTDQKKAPPEGGYKKGDIILAPIHGVVGREENGVIYLTDYQGRHLAFTPFISDIKDGDVVKAGQKIGKAEMDTKITMFKSNGAPSHQPKEPLVEIDPTKNYNKDYIEQTGNMESLKNFDYRKYIEAIDFGALSRSISTGTKSKPKKMPSLKAPKAPKAPTSKKSILQEFLDSEGK